VCYNEKDFGDLKKKAMMWNLHIILLGYANTVNGTINR
jgi:hypothetical protein